MMSLKRKRRSSTESREHEITTNASSEFTMTSLTIAVSSCALFRHETGEKGVAFPFVKALTMVNQRLTELDPAIEERCVIVVIPTDSQDMNQLNQNIEQYNLKESVRVCEIIGKKTLLDHLDEINPVLFLSTNQQDVKKAITKEYGAATMHGNYHDQSGEVLRVVFDGDGVLFSDESERVFKDKLLKGFLDNECKNEDRALTLGPLIKFFQALVRLQQKFAELPLKKRPIRTYLVTSRGTTGDGLRALKTLREKELEIDEAYFLSGAQKGSVLKAISPHIFFDDQMRHIKGALENGVIGAHVPYGVCNE